MITDKETFETEFRKFWHCLSLSLLTFTFKETEKALFIVCEFYDEYGVLSDINAIQKAFHVAVLKDYLGQHPELKDQIRIVNEYVNKNSKLIFEIKDPDLVYAYMRLKG